MLDFSSSAKPIYTGSISSPTYSLEVFNKIVVINVQGQRIESEEPTELSWVRKKQFLLSPGNQPSQSLRRFFSAPLKPDAVAS